jgi:hypothetical protein
MEGQPAVDPSLVLPLVLQVFPIPGSSDPKEFHGGPPSCPDPVGINVALSARLAISLRFGGHGLHYDPCPQYVRSSPASCMGNVPYNYVGGSSIQPPPHNYGYYHHGHGGPPAHHGGHPSAQVSPSVHGGRHALPRDLPSFGYGGGTFPQGHGGIPLRLHWLSQAWRLRACRFTLLCHRRITVPLLDLTLPCHLPALVEAYLLLSLG